MQARLALSDESDVGMAGYHIWTQACKNSSLTHILLLSALPSVGMREHIFHSVPFAWVSWM
jgi:hypothetical protein